MKKENGFSILVNSPLDCEYVQKLAFKAGYGWGAGTKQAVRFGDETEQLYFHNEVITRSGVKGKFNNPDKETYNLVLSLPADAVKICELFNTPEYKVGDYVVLADEGILLTEMAMFLGSVQKISSLPVINKEEAVLFTGIKWSFDRKNIARHATEEEIKKYKEGDDICIMGEKVIYYPKNIKIGCVSMEKETLRAFGQVVDYMTQQNYTFFVKRGEIYFAAAPLSPHVIGDETYFIEGETLNKILKKAGIK